MYRLLKFVWDEHNEVSAALAAGDVRSHIVKRFNMLALAEILIYFGITALLYPFLLNRAWIVLASLGVFHGGWRLYVMFRRQAQHTRKIKLGLDIAFAQRRQDWMMETAQRMAEGMHNEWKRERVERSMVKSGLPEVVYFILNPENQTIKIGFTRDLQSRFSGIQTGSAAKLQVLATRRGGKSLEQRLHRKFSHLRTSGEWFTYTDEIRALVSELTEENFGGMQQTANDVMFAPPTDLQE